MSVQRYEGSVRLLSSLSHGGEHAGTTGLLRREKFVQPDGAVEEVPVVSGNAIRGVLRDISARMLWEDLGRPELTMPVFHALFSGGSLAKTGAGYVIGDQQLRTLRDLCPHVSLFGCAGGGRIIEGRLMVGKLVPVCKQTAHVMPAELLDEVIPDMWDLVQLEEFSRVDDTKRLSNPAIPPATDRLEIGDGDDRADADGPAQQMRYGVETLAAGTLMHWWVQLRGATDTETATFARAVDGWVNQGAHIGGRSATGHGRLAVHVGAWATDPQLTTGTPLPDKAADRPDPEKVLEALSWLR